MAGKLLVSRNVNPAAEVSSALSPNVGNYGWTSYEASHFNQLLSYVDVVNKKSERMDAQVTYIDGRITDAEKALENVHKALLNTILKYDDFLVRYEGVLIYFNQMKDLSEQTQNMLNVMKQGVVEENYNGFYEMVAADANFFNIKLNAATTTLNMDTWGLVSQVTRIIVSLTQMTGDNEVTWDPKIKWPQGSEPTLATDKDHVDIFEFVTFDSGNTWFGSVFGRDYS